MKKLNLIILLLIGILLSSCGNKKQVDTKQVKEQLNEKTALLNVDEKVNLVKKELEKAGITGEKLKQELVKQKAGYEIIANLKGEARKKYVFEKEVLPAIVEDSSITPSFCKTNNIVDYTKCMNIKNIPLEKVLEKTPKQLQDLVKKNYYYQKYSLKRSNILQKTSDPVAIQMKKKKIEEMKYNRIITNPSVCSQLPEKEVQKYCKDLFK